MTSVAPSLATPAGDPFTALSPHFGMLLGVADLEASVGHGWAKTRLHNAWLHGPGVVWGFGVSLDAATGEVKVGPGLALDGLGRELYLPKEHCCRLRDWFEANKAAFADDPGQPFDAHIVVRYRACGSRPVPGLSPSCAGGEELTEYSRLTETVELFMVPHLAARERERYPRVRAFLSADQPPDAPAVPTWWGSVLRERGRIDALPTDTPVTDRRAAVMDGVRLLTALDGIDRRPAARAEPSGPVIFPGPSPDPLHPEDRDRGSVLLANLRGLRLADPVARQPISVGDIDLRVRPTHVDSATAAELISSPLLADPRHAGNPAIDSGAPRLDPSRARVVVSPQPTATVMVVVSERVLATSVERACTVHRFDPVLGWQAMAIDAGGYEPASSEIWLLLAAVPTAGSWLRVTVSGIGPAPLVAEQPEANGRPRPLAGIIGGPPIKAGAGADVVVTVQST